MLANVFGEGLVQRFRFFLQNAGGDGDSGFAQTLKPLPTHQRVGILHARDHARDSGRDDSIGTWRGASLMRTRLEVDVERRAACPLAGLLQRQDFGVLDAV